MPPCCGKAPKDEEPAIHRETRFPMWVISIRCFLEMAAGPPPCHQELMAQGKLVEWTAGMFCIFTSHQWLGWHHPDPTGQQTETLRSALRSIISGSLKVCSDLMTTLVYGQRAELSQEHRKKLEYGWLWLDWMSIPQLTMRRPGEGPEMEKQVEEAIWSIPAYAGHSDLFLVLSPSCEHRDTGDMCSHETWATRGWCRLEVAAAMMGSGSRKPYVVVTSPSAVFLEESRNYFHHRVGTGVFTDTADKQKLYPVMKDIVDKYVEFLWQSPERVLQARFFTAMRSNFLEGLVPEGVEEPEDDMINFLKKLHFDSATGAAKCHFGPMHCAAIAGSGSVLRELAAAMADVNLQAISAGARTMNDISLLSGSSPLLVAQWSARGRETACVLLELRADLHMQSKIKTNALIHAAACGNLGLMDYLLELGMDPEHQSQGGTALSLAAMTGQSGSVRFLLERGARPDGRNLFGATPLLAAALFGHTECCQVLVERSADLNARVTPPNLAGAAMYVALTLARPFLSRDNPANVLGSAKGRTAKAIALALGHLDIVRILEEAEGVHPPPLVFSP